MADLAFNDAELRELKRQCLHHNIFPSDVGYHRTDPPAVAAALNPIFDACLAQLNELPEDEVQRVIDSLSPGYRAYLEPFPEHLAGEFLIRVAEYCISFEIQKIYSPVSEVVDTHPADSEVLSVCPELESNFDDDGLLHLDSRFQLRDGGILFGDHFLHYHQFLRRGFSSNPNFDFTGTFARYFHDASDKNSFRIAIDHRRIMKSKDWQQCMELDTWYGPSFDSETLDDPSVTGLTVVGRSFGNLLMDGYPLIRSEFFWKTNELEHVKTLEIEELACDSKPYDNWHVNRYVHAERNIQMLSLIHI